jgi:hypothetical protein
MRTKCVHPSLGQHYPTLLALTWPGVHTTTSLCKLEPPSQGSRRPKGCCCRTIFLAALLWLSGNPLSAQPVPPEVLDAASNGLPAFLASVPATTRESYGFPSDSDLTQARLGAPLLQYTVTPAALTNRARSTAVSSLITETPLWYFPIQMNGETKALLAVDHMSDGWKAVSLGYAPLAREWTLVARQWPASKGYHPRLVTVFQAKQHYFTVPEVDDRNLTLIAPPQAAATVTKGATTSSSETSGRYSALGSVSDAVGNLRAVLPSAGSDSKH